MKGKGRRGWTALVAGLAALMTAAGCTTNPATGLSEFTLFMTPADEAALGREEHPKIVKAHGGVYDEQPALNAYVTEIGRRLQQVSERPDLPFTFTLLDSDAVNAFAVPGGYVYVSRGLLALADSEAELAGVIAHEIGHITARHTAQRVTQGTVAKLGAAVLGAATGSPAVGDIAELGAGLYLLSYSRQQEFEADSLGMRYLTRAAYDPEAMASFLRTLEAEDKLSARIAGRAGYEQEASLFSTHPRTVERVARAAAEARTALTRAPRVGHEAHLRRIDGLRFGDDPEEGFIRGRTFAHPKLRIRFEAPPGFRLKNSSKAVVAEHSNGARILFDGDDLPYDMPMTRYLVRQWPTHATLRDVEPIEVNGMAAATGRARRSTERGPMDLRGVAIRFDTATVYRFQFITPAALTDELALDLRRTTYSFRRLSEAEAAELKPLRIRVIRVKPGDTAATFAAMMPYHDAPLERFLVLNGLQRGEPLVPGRLVKIVAE
ncbi:MAG: M48 family metalloprotease [Alphaproteobacteria bacterium]